ncbi:transposase [Methylobacterium brachiatum]|uniref:Transposase n=1 Tax=Methylobacterium brachiatum TaxID=269660 RepID=A0AAJ1TR86_9HYPH|nr:transposase [Methylobacterium brachiatum]
MTLSLSRKSLRWVDSPRCRPTDLLRQDDPAGPEPWLDAAAATGLQGFAAGLRQDLDAVRAAITQPWNDGPVEGQVNRLKLIKRQMYDRAGFDLLQQRVLHAA